MIDWAAYTRYWFGLPGDRCPTSQTVRPSGVTSAMMNTRQQRSARSGCRSPRTCWSSRSWSRSASTAARGGALLSGDVIVSTVLSLPTVGPVLLQSLLSEDLYLASTIFLWLGMLTVIGTLISDLLLAVTDPRIRLS